MIVTICMNPSFDRTVTVDALTIGGTNRIRSARTDVGGKGVNVARVLTRLGMDARCVGLAGQENYALFRRMLDDENIPCRFVTVSGSVRTNTKVVSLSGLPVTELNEPGFAVGAEELKNFADMVEREAQEADWCILTGSLPGGCGPACYLNLMNRLKARCVLDAFGPALLEGLQARPYLVKPNQEELSLTLNRPLEDRRALMEAARELISCGAQNVLVSMAGEGAVLAAADGSVYEAPAPKGRLINGVGAGDSMVAGFLAGWMERQDYRYAFHMGISAGSASAFSEFLATNEEVEAVYRQVIGKEEER